MPKIEKAYLVNIAGQIRKGLCVPFLGAATNITSKKAAYTGLPLGQQVAEDLAARLHRKVADKRNLPRVSLLFERVLKRHALLEALKQLLPEKERTPSPLLQMLAQLPVDLFVTTNFDRLLERALEARQPFVVVQTDEQLEDAELVDQWLDQDGDGRSRRPLIQLEELFSSRQPRESQKGYLVPLSVQLAEDPSMSVVFVIREDYLVDLDDLAGLFPGRLRARFRVTGLRPEAALRAITQPLESARLSIEPEVAARIVEYLKADADLVDRFVAEAIDRASSAGRILIGPHQSLAVRATRHAIWRSPPGVAPDPRGCRNPAECSRRADGRPGAVHGAPPRRHVARALARRARGGRRSPTLASDRVQPAGGHRRQIRERVNSSWRTMRPACRQSWCSIAATARTTLVGAKRRRSSTIRALRG